MKKQFVTYDIALKLKELGFDEECFGYYTPIKDWMMKGKYSDGELHFHGPNWANNNNTMYFMYVVNSFGDRSSITKNSKFTKAIHNIAVPLWQQAQKWIRDKYDIYFNIMIFEDGIWRGDLIYEDAEYDWDDYNAPYDVDNCKTYEECLELLILKAIELIESK